MAILDTMDNYPRSINCYFIFLYKIYQNVRRREKYFEKVLTTNERIFNKALIDTKYV